MNDQSKTQTAASADDVAAKRAARMASNEAGVRAKWDETEGTQWKGSMLDQHQTLAKAFAGGIENPPSDPKYRNPVEGGSFYRDAKTGKLYPAQYDAEGAVIAPHLLPNDGIPVEAGATTAKTTSAPGPGKAAPAQPTQPSAASAGNQE